MRVNETNTTADNVQIEIRRHFTPEEFEVVDVVTAHNLVTTVGKGAIAERLKASPGAAGNPVTHMAIGTSSTAAAVGQTTLVAEVDRNALDSTNVTSNVATYIATFAAGDPSGTNSITEAGLFSASSGGNMWARVVFGVITKEPSVGLTITWTITIN